jgi:protein subunit release factor A
MSDLDTKLTEVANQYDDLQAELSRPEVSADPSEIRRLGQELSRLEPVVEAFRRLEATRTELAGARELRDSGDADDELRSMARDEIDRLEADEALLLDELKVLLLPRDPNDDRDVILEIRAGAGGDRRPLFGAELYRMYVRYAERHRFKPELLSLNETGIGGIKEAIIQSTATAPTAASSSRAASIASSASPPPSRRGGSTPPPRPSSSCQRSTRSRSTSTRSGTCGSTSSAHPGPAGSRSTRPTPRFA